MRESHKFMGVCALVGYTIGNELYSVDKLRATEVIRNNQELFIAGWRDALSMGQPISWFIFHFPFESWLVINAAFTTMFLIGCHAFYRRIRKSEDKTKLPYLVGEWN